MARVTIYLDDQTEKHARLAAEASGTSLGKWISGAIRDLAAKTWPQEVLNLAGTWKNFPLAEDLPCSRKRDSPRARF
jgi:hypothetical protein